ncbi:MAG: TlpA family protein disulfide reductase [Sulfuricaulis sp.]
MIRKIRWLLIVALLVPLLALAAGPNVPLKGFDGKDHNVNEYVGHGKWTIVAVWSKDCPICRRDIYHMAFFYDEHHKKDATVLGLSIDGFANRAKAQGFIDDQSLNFPNLIGSPDDPSRISGTLFIGTPTYYFFSPDGKFMTQRIGPVTQVQAEAIIRGFEKNSQPQGKI